jgi:hypothetical protein
LEYRFEKAKRSGGKAIDSVIQPIKVQAMLIRPLEDSTGKDFFLMDQMQRSLPFDSGQCWD